MSAEEEHPNVLIVDDRPANLLALEAVLEPLGVRIVKAGSGDEALKALLHEQFALILMDVRMPELSGIQTAALIQARERSRQIPIIFLTALDKDPAHVFAAYTHGAADYIVKPFNEEILRRKVAVFVQLHQQQERIRRQEAQLRAREREVRELEHARRFRALMDALPHYVWIADGDGTVHHVNRAWLEDSGLTHDENHGFGFLTGVHPDDRDDLSKAWRAAVASGRATEIQFRSLRERDRCFRWQLLRLVPERDEADRITGWIAVATDVDELRRVA